MSAPLFTRSTVEKNPLTPEAIDDINWERDHMADVGRLDMEREQRFERENGIVSLADLSDVQAGDVYSAWDLIGFDSENGCHLRIRGGRALYDAAMFNDAKGYNVKLARLDTLDGLREVSRYVDPDTEIEVV